MPSSVSAKQSGEELMAAVSAYDVPRVAAALRAGANANYRREDHVVDGIQPTSPLRLVLFRISDCFLTEEDLGAFAQIASMLLEAGADPHETLPMAEWRYGAYEPPGPNNSNESAFNKVYGIVANAAMRR
jgi:hypothetical protein